MGVLTGTITGVARNTKSYESTVKFALPYRQKEGQNWVDKWVNVVLFGKSAERFKEHGGNGTIVSVVGNISLNSYTKGDGTVSTNIELMAMSFDIIQKANQPQATPAQAPRPQPNRAHASQPSQPNRQATNAPPDDFGIDDDIPF